MEVDHQAAMNAGSASFMRLHTAYNTSDPMSNGTGVVVEHIAYVDIQVNDLIRPMRRTQLMEPIARRTSRL